MERLAKIVCWSCGGIDGNHKAYCAEGIAIVVKSPINPPPFCGTAETDVAVQDVRIRYCCICSGGWLCDAKTHVNGACQNGGETGAYPPRKHDSLNEEPILFKNIPKKFEFKTETPEKANGYLIEKIKYIDIKNISNE